MQDHVRPCSGVIEALAMPWVRLIYKVGLTTKCTQPWNKQQQILSVLIFRQIAQVFNVHTLVALRISESSLQKRGWKFTCSNCVWHIKTMSQDLAAIWEEAAVEQIQRSRTSGDRNCTCVQDFPGSSRAAIPRSVPRYLLLVPLSTPLFLQVEMGDSWGDRRWSLLSRINLYPKRF